MLRVNVLGPVEVRRDDAAVSVPGGKAGELLIRLALDANEVVRTERLLDDLWAEAAITTRRNTLQSKVARLRRALGEPSPIAGRDDGYVLEVDADAIDAATVIRDAAEATHLLNIGDAETAARIAASAVALYRGDVLPSVTSLWAEPHRARLQEVQLELLDTLFTARLQLGASGELVNELEAAVVAHPFQEGLWALLMTALYRAGRQADALAAFQRARAVLGEQLGLEPGPALRRLEREILDQQDALAATLPPATVTTNLPSMPAELVGRAPDLERVLQTVSAHRLVTVAGPGGIGKTALAIAAGRALTTAAHTTDIWLVRIDTATTADEVTDAVVAALGVTGGEAALVERLGIGRPLLILDNCEHLLDAVDALVTTMLEAAPNLRVLTTSQAPLGLEEEQIIELAPLALDAAVDLFTSRARTHGRVVRPESEVDVEQLCRALDGLPLAIELAAARTKTLSVADITRRLDDRFSVLADPTSRRPERRRALRSTISWSYELLFPDDKRGLWALSTFVGGGVLDAVEHVLAALDVPGPTAIDVLGRLANRSLLIVDEPDGGEIRYRLLDSIRAYALDELHDAGAAETARRAHAEWFAAAAAAADTGVQSADQAAHLTFVRTERSNIDTALAWTAGAAPALGLEIALGFGWSWIVLGDSRGADRLMTALSALPTASAAARATALLLAGWIEASTGELDTARAHVEEARTLACELDDPVLEGRADYYLAYVVSHDGRWQEALELTDRARRGGSVIARGTRPPTRCSPRAAISAGDEARSAYECDQVRHWLAGTDDPWLHVRGEAILGELARVQHRFADAVTHLANASSTSERLGFRQTAAYQLSSLGRAQCQNGDYVNGTATLAESIRRAEATGDVRLAALIRIHLGRTLRAIGDDAGAHAALEDRARVEHERVGGGEQAALGDCLLAALDAAGDDPSAAARLEAIRANARNHDDAPVAVFALDALARIAAGAGDLDRARQLRAEADRCMETASHFISERDRVDAQVVASA